jgi:hypothetical protein
LALRGKNRHLDIFKGAEPGEYIQTLKGPADSHPRNGMGGESGDILSFKDDPPGIHWKVPGEKIE